MKKNFNKWHLMAIIFVLYALIVAIAMLTHQPAGTMSMLIDRGAPGIGLLCFLILLFG
ncbi:MAG: hypothetical protein UW46_C0008G0019 [Candidatus Yanofskybacteria bacterium GW2011_GWF1_44_227]|uniref:Uncharacterized protein n=1 Tax=Candidatus Yanofskybacteria bacterium GW2011_GWE2_40_11 TaxID=1619033 RepID=A0A0G0TQX3_9BACT|nr:MAG: hypothetical protein UT69_C0003G0018 [Candidatus Yanofskybacteria bacterium GW2011_GWE1_40_10]KKR40237.1 MAG: hypothetical protein UT75_C0009G0010 [Candidatus Yanofskybacteria bacterium GW2011_GWE2_40_11]KKT15343.1 MAG: hypothetical protein UV97_C0009G0019 [Candidatus Yanofskybacteria bacterium GW2011_GWF2_43_596]KKT52987.1 MAG: hypothetical protein UW46_C0008G0019 [Candidatus Yanofskybacteria bacterium GW2011_GWF1_44_227]